MGANVDCNVHDGKGPYCYKIHGSIYHHMGSLIPNVGDVPKFAQLYIYDTENEISNRQNIFTNNNKAISLNPYVICLLKNMLDALNPYVKIFRSVSTWKNSLSDKVLQLRILETRKHGIQYSTPAANEVAALVVADVTETNNSRDIVILTKEGLFQNIKESHPAYMPLQYPLLFPYGEDGWRFNMIEQKTHLHSTSKMKKITMLNYYAFRLQMRSTEGYTLLKSGRLLQQYMVDAYVAIESERLGWFRRNQDKIRAESYKNVKHAFQKGFKCKSSW